MNRVTGRNTRTFKKLPLCVALLGCIYGTSALAQTPPPQTPQQLQQAEEAERERLRQQEAVELDRVVVTGSLLRRQEYSSISPVQVITADTNVALGQIDTAEFLQKSSVAAGSTQINAQFSGFVVGGGTGVQTVSLRGLGAQRTAVLLNGNRPGPAGTRGQVQAFDLNVIPSSIVQRIEVLKDGTSSIYGSDAVAGAINIITRKNIDRPEFTISTRTPFEGGGEAYTVSGATGFNFDNGNIVVAAEYFLQTPLRFGDRDYLRCSEDLFWNEQGNRIDREDRSILAGTRYAGCTNTGIINAVDDAVRGPRYVPSWDGTTIGLIPGYRPNLTGSYANNSPNAFHHQVLNSPLYDDVQMVDRQERMNVFASSSFMFGDISWDTELLLNRRNTQTHRMRQFFPLIGGATSPFASYRYVDNPTFAAPVPGGIARPIMPFNSDQDVTIDYGFINTTLEGPIGNTSWIWSGNASYSRSSGDYSSLSIVKSLTGDADPSLRKWTGGLAPTFDYFQPCALSGDCIDDLEAAVGRWHTGNTVYDQAVFQGLVTGDAFEMPAGTVGMALGVEHRRFSIDDQPSELERTGELWGQSSAVQTKGSDNVTEVFGEVEVPLLKGVPAFEALTLNMSARAFNYDTVDDWNHVWKVGLGWQVVPSLLLRSTKGTSYRAPGLYELYLGNLSGFAGQLSIDPCIRWGESNNDRIRANCGAAGIPDDYAALGGSGASAEVFTRGAGDTLRPETSNAFTGGLVWTPSFMPVSFAVDYFDMQVNDQITQLGASGIVGGCYGAEVYPNDFCNLFIRNPNTHPTAPNKIEEVYATYININKQKVRGYDLLARYDNTHAFGRVIVEGEFTYMVEDFSLTFTNPLATGLTRGDRLGDISRPQLVGNLTSSLRRNDFTYTWGMQYVGETEALNLDEVTTYFGRPNSRRDITADSALYHNVSVRFEQPNWNILVGIRNVLDKAPPRVSSGVATRYGNSPAFATQYDWFGQSLFVRYNHKF